MRMLVFLVCLCLVCLWGNLLDGRVAVNGWILVGKRVFSGFLMLSGELDDFDLNHQRGMWLTLYSL